MILTLFWTVAFCLGWRIVTDEGQLLNFLRKPFDDAITNAEVYEERRRVLLQFNTDKELIDVLEQRIFFAKLIYYIGKPFILCITCMASVWGFVVFVSLNGFNETQITRLIINCISASFIQTFIWSAYVRYFK